MFAQLLIPCVELYGMTRDCRAELDGFDIRFENGSEDAKCSLDVQDLITAAQANPL